MNHGCAGLGLIALGLVAPVPAMALTDGEFQAMAAEVLAPVIAEHDIPGLAVGVTWRGERFVFTAGMADRATKVPVTADTLFELGSISKTFNATLAALAEERGLLSLGDTVSARLPALSGSAFDVITLADLATHHTGGLPLQVPDEVTDLDGLLGWLRDWRPEAKRGHERSYSNISIGLLGRISADAFGAGYEQALASHVLNPLELEDTFVTVPPQVMNRYALGYGRDGDRPIRVNPGVLDAESYGVKSSVLDMLTFLEANLGGDSVPADLAAALAATHKGRTRTRHFSQGMIWERYAWPADPAQLLAGNDLDMILNGQHAERLVTPETGEDGVLLGKTGSTNGFGGYIALVPEEDLGIVILANRNYPVPARIEAALALMAGLGLAQ